MDNLYRFGSVEVICEGYDYPDDPYILKGTAAHSLFRSPNFWLTPLPFLGKNLLHISGFFLCITCIQEKERLQSPLGKIDFQLMEKYILTYLEVSKLNAIEFKLCLSRIEDSMQLFELEYYIYKKNFLLLWGLPDSRNISNFSWHSSIKFGKILRFRKSSE